MGRYDYAARALNADRPWRAGGVRAGADPQPDERGAEPSQGAGREVWPQAENDRPPEARGAPAAGGGRTSAGHRPQLQRQPVDDCEATGGVTLTRSEVTVRI